MLGSLLVASVSLAVVVEALLDVKEFVEVLGIVAAAAVDLVVAAVTVEPRTVGASCFV